jgi:hypothetical protein
MECLIGLVGGDYAMIAADMNAGRSIMVFNQEADRIMEMDSHKLLGVCGDPADCVNEPQFFQKNLNLYALRNAEKQLSTHATANYMRGEKSANLRKGMKQVDMLLCGFDEGKGPSLYFIDYLASMQKLNVAGHGYGGMFVNRRAPPAPLRAAPLHAARRASGRRAARRETRAHSPARPPAQSARRALEGGDDGGGGDAPHEIVHRRDQHALHDQHAELGDQGGRQKRRAHAPQGTGRGGARELGAAAISVLQTTQPTAQ